jgi:lactoylglutathione lyase
MSSAETDAPIALLDRRIQQDDGLTGGHVNYKLCNVRVFVTDWRRAIRFYTDTLDMAVAHRNDDIGWAQMATGEGQLSLERVDVSDDEGRALIGRFVGVSLEVADIFATHKFLAARGVEFVSPPEKQPWGGVLAHLRDPDGNILTLVANK